MHSLSLKVVQNSATNTGDKLFVFHLVSSVGFGN